jgi:ABC-type glutathione transport system ATPase component
MNPKMTVGELLREAITLQKPLPREDVLRRSEDLISLVKLKSAKLSAYPPDLSGGEKRRVSIARVLALEPKLIVADEPLSALACPGGKLDAGLAGDARAHLSLHLP